MHNSLCPSPLGVSCLRSRDYGIIALLRLFQICKELAHFLQGNFVFAGFTQLLLLEDVMRASLQSSEIDRLRTAETPLKLWSKPTTLPWRMSSMRTGDTTALWQQGRCGL